MKKNKMMRLASVMMVMTLMTTSVISGTFAKYVTQDSASDSARVAGFGVVVTAQGTLFGETYMNKEKGNIPGTTEMTVESKGAVNDIRNVVAPGTKSKDEGMTFAITGQPEVAVRLDVTVENTKDIFLKEKKGLPKMTTGKSDDTFDNDADYYPVKYTLTQTNSLGTTTLVDGGNIEALTTALTGLSLDYEANDNLADKVGTLKITWVWDFDGSGLGTYDDQDTLLGDLAAGTTLKPETTLTAGTDYNLETGIKVTVKVTQID